MSNMKVRTAFISSVNGIYDPFLRTQRQTSSSSFRPNSPCKGRTDLPAEIQTSLLGPEYWSFTHQQTNKPTKLGSMLRLVVELKFWWRCSVTLSRPIDLPAVQSCWFGTNRVMVLVVNEMGTSVAKQPIKWWICQWLLGWQTLLPLWILSCFSHPTSTGESSAVAAAGSVERGQPESRPDRSHLPGIHPSESMTAFVVLWYSWLGATFVLNKIGWHPQYRYIIDMILSISHHFKVPLSLCWVKS